MISNRAWVLLPSGRRLDLLNPDPQAWTDHDLSVGLSRTYRWAGYSAWDLPLSVAQHSLTVLAIRQGSPGPGLTPPEALRELLHDAEEALLGGWDPITPLKPHLGPGFDALVRRLQAAVAERYQLPAWTPASYALHKHVDRLAGFEIASGQVQALAGVTPYDLNTPLFSDYAVKYRTVWMPAGKSAAYDATNAFDFPVGTIFTKSFGNDHLTDLSSSIRSSLFSFKSSFRVLSISISISCSSPISTRTQTIY